MLLLQVVGVSGRRPERRAGVLPVVTTMMTEMMLKERKDPATASETVVQTGGPDRPKPRVLIYLFFVINADVITVTLSVSCLCYVNQCHDVFTERSITGGKEAQRKQAAGEILAKRTLTAMIVVTVKIAVVTAVIETAGMTVNTEAHPETMMMVSRA